MRKKIQETWRTWSSGEANQKTFQVEPNRYQIVRFMGVAMRDDVRVVYSSKTTSGVAQMAGGLRWDLHTVKNDQSNT